MIKSHLTVKNVMLLIFAFILLLFLTKYTLFMLAIKYGFFSMLFLSLITLILIFFSLFSWTF